MSAARALYVTFALQAFASGVILPRVPELQAKLQLTETELGAIFTAGALGGILTSLVAGGLARRYGTKGPVLSAICVMGIANVLAALAPSAITLGAVFFCSGLGFGISNVAMNLEADRMESALKRRIMNRCHGLWSIGVLAATLVGVGARAVPVPVTWHFFAMTALIFIALGWLMANLSEAPPRGNSTAKRSALAKPDASSVLVVLFAFSASVGHMTANTWSVIFARDSFAAPDWVDTLTLPAFLGAMTVARLVADSVISRFGTVITARAMACCAALGALCLIVSQNVAMAILGFALIGLGTGPLFPMMVTAAARLKHRPPEESVAAVILLITAVATVTPIAMGALAEAFGLRAVFAVMLPLSVLSYLLARRVTT